MDLKNILTNNHFLPSTFHFPDMKFSYNWLKEYVNIKETPEKLAEVLTMHSFEAEGIEKIGNDLAGVVVGEIKAIKKHPNANKLNIAEVDVGEIKFRQIIFGQMVEMDVGLKIPVALAPTILPGNKKIDRIEMRGVLSEGMFCLDQELGLAKEGVSIKFFGKDIKNGTRILDILHLSDTLIDLNILPDRAHDALSYWGLSREIAAVLARKMKKGIYNDAKSRFAENKKENIKKIIKADIQDKKLCRRYSARVIKNISVAPSPLWIQDKLKLSSIRPINNLVDIANLVMLETGQPLHIFDFDKIEDVNPPVGQANGAGKSQIPNPNEIPNPKSQTEQIKKIIIRRAKKGEKILALDGKEYKLDENNLVIADAKKPLAIAGIMGGEYSGATSKTKNIVIEAASFDPVNIRQSGKALGLASDSSYRFEREMDRNLTILALNRATELIQEISGGEVVCGAIDAYPAKTRPIKIKLEISAVEKLLGVKISVKKIVEILNNLGLAVKKGRKETLEIIAPTRRLDIAGPIEVIREIGRIYGYEKIVPVKPKVELNLPEINPAASYRNKIKNILAANGFTEIYNYSFIGEKELSSAGARGNHYLELANPLNPEHKYLRLSLAPSVLNNISDNSRTLADENIKIFELGKVYYRKYTGNNACMLSEASAPGASEIDEKFMLAGAIYDKNSKELFYQTKEIVELLLNFLGIKNAAYSSISEQCAHMPVWHLGRAAYLSVGQSVIGIMGEIDSKIRENFKIDGRVGLFNLDFNKIAEIATAEKAAYEKFSKFPSIKLDFAVLAPKKILWSEIEKVARSAGGGLVKNIELFDIYEGKNIITDNLIGKRSLAFHVVYQSREKTLKDEEVKEITDKIIEELKNKLGVSLRR